MNTSTTSASRAVVIGSGFGGLSAAVRLRALGYDVVVVEALDQPGGRARVFKDQGFTFDAGPTVITAPYLLEELFTLLGRDANDYYSLLPVDPFYRVEFPDGARFDYVGEEDRILAQIEQFDRRDVDGYRRMVRHMKDIFDVGYLGLADKPFGKFSDMLKVAPDMMRLESYRTVYGLASKYLHNEQLRQVFTFQPLLVGGNPFRTTSIYSMIHWLERKWGVWFVKGGTTALVHAFVRLLDDVGVPVRCNSPVTRIDVQGGRTTGVVLESGERIPCDIVVSNGDPSMVYTKLIGAEHRSKYTDRAVARVKGSMGLFVAYFGTDSRAEGPNGKQPLATKFEEIKHHTIVLGPRYKGLLDDIFRRKVLADDFSLYLHRPTATDRSLAPAGHDAWYVLSPVPNLTGGQDWEQLAPAYLEKIMKSLDRLAPGLSSSMTAVRHIDPRNFEREYRTMHGAAFGPEPVLTQSAWFRYHNASPDVGGLYFVGAGTHPGAGVPGVISSAKVLERVVERPARPAAVPAARPASSRRAAE
jgi:phytoene desaturase